MRTGRARARIAGSWQSGACYVQRAENSCACFFFSSSLAARLGLSLPLFLSLYLSRSERARARSTSPAPPAPFAFFGRSSRKRTATPRSRFHTWSLLFLAMPCTTRICVGQRSDATSQSRTNSRDSSSRFLLSLSLSHLVIDSCLPLGRFPRSLLSGPVRFAGVFAPFSLPLFLLSSTEMSGVHEYGTIAVTQMFAAARGHNRAHRRRLSYVTDCR